MGHIPEDWLERYSLGTLEEPLMAPLEEHLLICHLCQDRLVETDDFLEAMRAAAAPETKQKGNGDQSFNPW